MPSQGGMAGRLHFNTLKNKSALRALLLGFRRQRLENRIWISAKRSRIGVPGHSLGFCRRRCVQSIPFLFCGLLAMMVHIAMPQGATECSAAAQSQCMKVTGI